MRSPKHSDIAFFVKKVVFTLHPTFQNNVRAVEKFPFEVQEQGWGEFEITVKIHFVDSSEKAVELHHLLRLFPEEKAGSARNRMEPVISEVYDEIVFSEPTEHFRDLLMQAKPPPIPSADVWILKKILLPR